MLDPREVLHCAMFEIFLQTELVASIGEVRAPSFCSFHESRTCPIVYLIRQRSSPRCQQLTPPQHLANLVAVHECVRSDTTVVGVFFSLVFLSPRVGAIIPMLTIVVWLIDGHFSESIAKGLFCSMGMVYINCMPIVPFVRSKTASTAAAGTLPLTKVSRVRYWCGVSI